MAKSWAVLGWSESNFYGFRMDDKTHSHYVSLEDLAIMKEYEVMDVIDQGTCRVG